MQRQHKQIVQQITQESQKEKENLLNMLGDKEQLIQNLEKANLILID